MRDIEKIDEMFGQKLETAPETPFPFQATQVIQMLPPPRSPAQDAASWILLAYVGGFAMISLIAGVMMFL